MTTDQLEDMCMVLQSLNDFRHEICEPSKLQAHSKQISNGQAMKWAEKTRCVRK